MDGVVFDTESQYSVFWGEQCRKYHPDRPGLENQIKGQTLVMIFDKYFSDLKDEQPKIVARLDEFERNMKFEYVGGFIDFVSGLRRNWMGGNVALDAAGDSQSAVFARQQSEQARLDVTAERWPGVIPLLEKGMQYGDAWREVLARFRQSTECPDCHGARLRPDARCAGWISGTLQAALPSLRNRCSRSCATA